jgi:hypothetical protein
MLSGPGTMIAVASWHGRLWWVATGPAAGTILGVVDSVVNHVPVLPGGANSNRQNQCTRTAAAGTTYPWA